MINNPTALIKLAYPIKYDEFVTRYAIQYNQDPYLIYAVIRAESKFDPKAQSHRGAKGLMQLTARTGSWGAESLKFESFNENDLFDPETNIKLGCWYLAELNDEFDNNLRVVITAYNGGSGRVREWLQDQGIGSDGNNLDIPYTETEKYVQRVLNDYSVYKKLYASKQ
jgi:soluble lytic murein transglycosylase